MRMHERLGHAAHEEADEDIPNEVKHIFLLTPDSAKITRSNIRTVEAQPRKISMGFP